MKSMYSVVICPSQQLTIQSSSLDPNGLRTYPEYRFRMFQQAINAKYPDIVVMTSYSNNTISNHTEVPQAAAGDYHQYSTPDAFVLTQSNFFDQNPVDSRTLIGLLLTYICVNYDD